MMNSFANPFVDLCHTQLEAARRFADVLFSGRERIDQVLIQASHRAFTENVNLAHAALSMRDPKELANIQSSMLAQRPDSAMSLQKEVMRVFAEIQNELGRSLKDGMERLGSSVAQGATAPLRSVQERVGENIGNPLSGMFSMWENAMREMTNLASKNIATTRSGYQHMAEDVTHATVDAGNRAADQGIEAARAMAQQAGYAATYAATENEVDAESAAASGKGSRTNGISANGNGTNGSHTNGSNTNGARSAGLAAAAVASNGADALRRGAHNVRAEAEDLTEAPMPQAESASEVRIDEPAEERRPSQSSSSRRK